jgi:4-carboxymuconolactone decarboxylase
MWAPLRTEEDWMARIDEKHNATVRMANWYTRRSYGRDTEIAGVMAHSPSNFRGYGMFEFFHERAHHLDEKLKALAGTKAACLIGCQFCIDIGSHLSRQAGVTEEQLRNLHAYRESPAFSPVERLVLEYAEAMCQVPASVSDELFARLREHFDEEQIIELTSAIAIENFRARFNEALGITPAGFSSGEYCAVPDAVAAQVTEAERTSA